MKKYDDIPAVRRSVLWEMRKSPAHCLYAATHESEPTPALAFGTAAHKYVLEPETFWEEYVIAPEVNKRTKAGKEEWEQFQAELEESGMTAISQSDLDTIKEMYEAIKANPVAHDLLRNGDHEVPIQWTDPITGERCKCRPDVLGKEFIVDYKTTTSCEDGSFERSCRYYGYKLQAAMYLEGVFNTKLEDKKFAFVAQEKSAPYVVRVYYCDPGFIEEGAALYRELMDKYHLCRVTDTWPGYEDKELLGDE